MTTTFNHLRTPIADGNRCRVQGKRTPRRCASTSVQTITCFATGFIATFFYVLLLPEALALEPTAEQLKAFSDAQTARIKLVEAELAKAELNLDKAKKLRVRRQAVGENQKRQQAKERSTKLKATSDAEAAVKKHSDELSRLRVGEFPRQPSIFVTSGGPSFEPVTLGMVGTLSNFPTRVLQVLGDNELLLRVGEVPSIIAMLRIPAAGLTDGVGVRFGPERLFVVTGTYEYTAVNGAPRTVSQLEELNMQAVRDHVRAKIAEIK